MDTKQVIVMRADLNMRKGKMVAQGSHATLGVFLSRCKPVSVFKFFFSVARKAIKNKTLVHVELTKEMIAWINANQKKICVRVDSEEELLSIYNQANEKNLPVYLVTDAGLTEFGGVPTKTCLAIGPANSSDIDNITSHLKLL